MDIYIMFSVYVVKKQINESAQELTQLTLTVFSNRPQIISVLI